MIARPPKRPEFIPGAPLYARQSMTFSGVIVARGGLIPVRPERKLRLLWRAGKATHVAPLAKVVAPPVVIEQPKRSARASR